MPVALGEMSSVRRKQIKEDRGGHLEGIQLIKNVRQSGARIGR